MQIIDIGIKYVSRVKYSMLSISDMSLFKSNQIKSNYFIVRLKVDQRAGQLSLPHLGITKTVGPLFIVGDAVSDRV